MKTVVPTIDALPSAEYLKMIIYHPYHTDMINVTNDRGDYHETLNGAVIQRPEFENVPTSFNNFSNRDQQQHIPHLPTKSLQLFHEWFLEVHGYASIIVCLFGIFTNIFNITVLMAKDMRTATNHLLTYLAVADILTMVPYIPYAINFYCPATSPMESPWRYSYGWVVYMVIMIHLLATTHSISIWLAVTLAAFRFNQIRSPCPRGPLAKERRIRQVKIATAVVYLTSIIVMIPNYVSNEIVLLPNMNTSAFGIKELKLGTPQTELVIFTNMLTYAVLAKVLPCVLILIFSGSLLYNMGIKSTRRRQRLSTSRQHFKTNRMLLAVLVMFIFTELPQGIFLILSATVPYFYDTVSYPLGDLIDFVSLLNNAINFVLYCVMSQQFREKFFNIYIKPLCERRRSMITSTSELLILRENVPRTVTTTTHEDNVKV